MKDKVVVERELVNIGGLRSGTKVGIGTYQMKGMSLVEVGKFYIQSITCSRRLLRSPKGKVSFLKNFIHGIVHSRMT